MHACRSTLEDPTGLSRSRELGIRAALGASRWQLVRALLLESLILSIVGTSLGLVVAWLGTDLIRSTMPANVPRVSAIAIDVRVLAASACLAVSTGLFFGLLPALQFSRPNLVRSLRDADRSVTTGVAKQRVRSVLVAGEVALAVVLLAGSGLFLSSFGRVMAIDLGIDHERVLTMPVPLGLSRPRNMTEADRRALVTRARASFDAVLARVQAVPGVERAAIFSGAMPLTGSSNTVDLTVPSADQQDRRREAEIKRVTPDYHVTLGISLRGGRYFTSEDREDGVPVAILNDLAASQFFGGTAALGQTVNVSGQPRTIVGVVGAVRQNGPETPAKPELYVPLSQAAVSVGDMIIRTKGDPATVVPDVRRALLSVLPNAVLPAPRTMNQLLGTLVAQRRFNMLLFSLFGVLGLVIALVGIYGVMAYVVEQRTVEFGVRMALGAPRGRILRSVLARAAVYLGIGLGIGLGAALGLSRFVASFLFEITPGAPGVYLLAAGLLLLVGFLAAFVPAWRASRVDPVTALRA